MWLVAQLGLISHPDYTTKLSKNTVHLQCFCAHCWHRRRVSAPTPHTHIALLLAEQRREYSQHANPRRHSEDYLTCYLLNKHPNWVRGKDRGKEAEEAREEWGWRSWQQWERWMGKEREYLACLQYGLFSDHMTVYSYWHEAVFVLCDRSSDHFSQQAFLSPLTHCCVVLPTK